MRLLICIMNLANVCIQVYSADIDAMKERLVDKLAPMKGIAKAHHVFSSNKRIYHRELACHCSVGLCQCFQPEIWEPHPGFDEAILESDDEPVEPDPTIPDRYDVDQVVPNADTLDQDVPDADNLYQGLPEADILNQVILDADILDQVVLDADILDQDMPKMPRPLREVLANRGLNVPPPDDTVKCNDFVLVRFVTQSAGKAKQPPHAVYFVGNVVRMLSPGTVGSPLYEVQCMRRKGSDTQKFVYPTVQDVCFCPREDILLCLSLPTRSRFSTYTFADDLAPYAKYLR
jgi:hypothetical protein